MNADYIEEAVCGVDELADGAMKEVRVGDTEVLLARADGKYYALYPKCAHYQAPLEKGILHKHKLICPWHNACFDIRNGQRLEAPSLNGLTTHEVRVEHGQVWVRLTTDKQSRVNPLAAPDKNNAQICLIVGGGGAGAFAAEGLRQGGFTGRILMLTQGEEVPYDRPNCSKNYLQGKAPDAWMPLRDKAFYEQYGIEIRTGEQVLSLDPVQKEVRTESGERLTYDRALICPGGEPNRLDVPGAELGNIMPLRSLADSRQLRALSQQAKRVVIIGSSFIGLEGAMSLQKLGCDVTVVGKENTPFEQILGDRIGRVMQGWHEKEGISFRLGRQVIRFEGDKNVDKVVLDNGDALPADFVLLGIGVKPRTAFLQGIPLEQDGGVKTDACLQLAEGLFAAGDIVHYPSSQGLQRVEHWKVAGEQGHTAGLNMARSLLEPGDDNPPMAAYQSVPFFWSNQQSKRINYVGYAERFEEIIYAGNPETDSSFMAFYVQDGKIRAVASLKQDQNIAMVRELMARDQMPPVAAVREGINWADALTSLT